MTVYDLNRDQLQELKQRYYADITGEDLSYDEIYRIDELVSDAEIYRYYQNFSFTNDDFFCTAGQDEEPESTLEDKLLALEAKVRFIQDSSYIPFVSPYPSSTEKQLADWVQKAAVALNMAANCAHLLRY